MLLRVLNENMSLMEGIEGSTTRSTKASAKKALLRALIEEESAWRSIWAITFYKPAVTVKGLGSC